MEAGQALGVNGKKSRTIRLSVNPWADFREIIHTFDAIEIPPTRVSIEHIRFAILELVNNSIRAHRERGETRDILIDLTIADGMLRVSIRDFGGGFDPGKLPYDLKENAETLDLHSTPFQEYQKKHDYKRFGMGIYIAKKTFDRFRLVFLDAKDSPASWPSESILGTFITLELRIDEGHGRAHGADI